MRGGEIAPLLVALVEIGEHHDQESAGGPSLAPDSLASRSSNREVTQMPHQGTLLARGLAVCWTAGLGPMYHSMGLYV